MVLFFGAFAATNTTFAQPDARSFPPLSPAASVSAASPTPSLALPPALTNASSSFPEPPPPPPPFALTGPIPTGSVVLLSPPPPVPPGVTWVAPERVFVATPAERSFPSNTTVPPRSSSSSGAPARWYGWQTLLFDGAAVVLLSMGAASGSGSGSSRTLAYADFFIAPPLVHLAHGNSGKALGSLALRVLPAAVGAGLIASAKDNDDRVGAMVGGALLLGSGVITAVVLDATTLSYERAPSASKSGSLPIVPSARLVRNGSVLGLSGAF